ncbi:MAG: transposase [Calditrichaeota bacterium]|nr:transposase [Calditrichota bacterium]
MIYLPAYSPNLNIIERLWKYLRKTVIDYYYYEKYSDFKAAILTFFETIEQHRQPDLPPKKWTQS